MCYHHHQQLVPIHLIRLCSIHSITGSENIWLTTFVFTCTAEYCAPLPVVTTGSPMPSAIHTVLKGDWQIINCACFTKQMLLQKQSLTLFCSVYQSSFLYVLPLDFADFFFLMPITQYVDKCDRAGLGPKGKTRVRMLTCD